jgi:hypothetical protein
MISGGYEKAIFASPVSDRYSLAEAAQPDSERGSTRVVTDEFDFLRDLRRAARIVKLVVNSKDTLFNVVAKRHLGGELAIEPTRLGWALMALSHITQEEMALYFPKHGFNPYVDLLFNARKESSGAALRDDWIRSRGYEAVRVAAQLNAFVSEMRTRASERKFQNLLDRVRRNCDKNTRSMKHYIDAIFRHRGGRHLVLRLDLAFAMEDAWAAARPTTVTLKQAKEDLVKFQRYLREHLPVTGFAAKLEYGLLRGYHFHAMIFLNGHLMHKDILIAKRLGEYWERVICEGKGRYWNCNAVKYEVRGIGMINYDDGDKRVALIEKVAGSLTKSDFWMRFQPGGKTLFKGLMPEPPPKSGRPRKGE